jgi:hypothetical protein
MIEYNAPVTFDVKNVTHRKAFNDFLKNHSWKDTNLRFILEHPFVDIPSMIHAKLINYYLTKEFK